MKPISNQQGIDNTRYIFYGTQLIGIFPIDTLQQIVESKKHFIPEAIICSRLLTKYVWARINANGKGEYLPFSDFPSELKPIAALLGLPLPSATGVSNDYFFMLR